ncbi:phosphotransferase family protein [Qiania dongpingensis]|uniref:Phosphotransferase n=1 Tax=Qiania dongpingensis TaxID=2763669 RepID=A0A7G9G1X4_9FIRM|nr:aminoglycoside phosphotransferase family protein [Qiania dongpingensis]QNM04806.1 phosphotransferase [Qiania dongpingensis]
MKEKILIASGNHNVYREGNYTVKVFQKGFPKSEVLREAMHMSLVEGLGMHVPELHSVGLTEDGSWAITYDYIEGKTLMQLMEEHPEKLEEYVDGMLDCQLEMFEKKAPLLNNLKSKMKRQIQSLDCINDITRYELLTKLNSMPDHAKLCHGDFCPSNIIVGEDGWYILDWIHASQGNASADVARTYLLLALQNLDAAYYYLNRFCERTGTAKIYVQNWLPLVAAAQLTKKRPEESELLQSWLNVVDTD